ncbi:MAG: hypothetical protein OEY44_00395 [Candidatus Peregrinibacteria bacterium]|nr:hypothetical protein [Candidatus Peregrinibacteria bacterium]
MLEQLWDRMRGGTPDKESVSGELEVFKLPHRVDIGNLICALTEEGVSGVIHDSRNDVIKVPVEYRDRVREILLNLDRISTH